MASGEWRVGGGVKFKTGFGGNQVVEQRAERGAGGVGGAALRQAGNFSEGLGEEGLGGRELPDGEAAGGVGVGADLIEAEPMAANGGRGGRRTGQ